MPRTGQNPMKWVKKTHNPSNITATTIVHIPSLDSYWKDNLKVLQLCLSTMRSNTTIPFDLLVFDNGSCQDVRDYLTDLMQQGEIQYLILFSRNIGKAGAWNFIFQSAPGEIIAFSDSDVYFLPGWLEASLRVMNSFPKAGIVTAQPIAGGDISTLWTAKDAACDETITINTGKLIPDEYLKAYLNGIGRFPSEYETFQKGRNDVMLTTNGVNAYATASHFQFITKKEVVDKIFPIQYSGPFSDTQPFDKDMEDLGLWRLSTTEYLVHHMGNHIPDFAAEVPWLKINTEVPNTASNEKTKRITARKRIWDNYYVRKMMKRILAKGYGLLYGE
jgi:glycosyltransferase involved in cell wall biosynthesis